MITPENTPLLTPFEIRVVVSAARAGRGDLTLLRNGRLFAQTGISIQAGKNVYRFEDRLEKEGLFLYQAVLNAPEDAIHQNNEGLTFIRATEKRKILYISEREDDHMARALEQQGLHIVRSTADTLAPALHELVDFSAIILHNLDGSRLSWTFLDHLEKYVRDLGGGLIMVGGDYRFGAGGYLNTPVEKALPVTVDLPASMNFPAFCLILVIDKSSSMAASLGGPSKLEAAKRAAFSTVELLNPMDKVALLAFDSAYEWVVPPTEAAGQKEIAEKLSTLIPNGGTDLLPALAEAHRLLARLDAGKKHVLVLSDGQTQKGDFETLVRAMNHDGITISTVALGSGADRRLLADIAAWGQGRPYYTEDTAHIPRIFTGETSIAAQQAIMEKPLAPILIRNHEITSGLEAASFPQVRGLAVTHPKPNAETILDTPANPLLVAWRYGLGRSLAYTSDLSDRWGHDWIAWEHFGQFASQMVKWAQRKAPRQNYAATISRDQNRIHFVVDIWDEGDRFVNNLDLNLLALYPSKEDQTFQLDQTAPGRYEAGFPAGAIGEYYLNLFGKDAEGTAFSQMFGYGLPYTDEFKATGINRSLLRQIADLTNGRVMSLRDDPGALFHPGDHQKRSGGPLWPGLALAALALFLLDVLVRKLAGLKLSG